MNKHYGLRLQVTGLSGYYTLLNQSQNHFTNEPMPNPGDFVTETSYQQERNGYRKNAGTSIAIRLNPGKLGTLNLKNTVENICVVPGCLCIIIMKESGKPMKK